MITTLATGYMIFTVILVGAPYMKVLPNASFVRFVTYNLDAVSSDNYCCGCGSNIIITVPY